VNRNLKGCSSRGVRLVDTQDYRDSAKKLNLKLLEIAERELKGKETVKREILCKILHIQISDKVTTENLIREALAPICLRNRLTFGDVKHKMLCDFFSVPVYFKPKKKLYLEYRILKLLVEVCPKELPTSEIANSLGEDAKYVINMLQYYSAHHNSWFEKILVNKGKRMICRWKVTSLGIEAYNSGEAKLLRKHFHVLYIKSKSPRKMEIRKCTPKALKILNVLAPAEFPLTSRTISNATGITIDHVCDTMKNDRYSIYPFFDQIKRDGCNCRYQASKAGIEYYYKQKRGI
jgi:hypothetical protein